MAPQAQARNKRGKSETRNTKHGPSQPLPNSETRNTAKHKVAGNSETRNTEAGETPLGADRRYPVTIGGEVVRLAWEYGDRGWPFFESSVANTNMAVPPPAKEESPP